MGNNGMDIDFDDDDIDSFMNGSSSDGSDGFDGFDDLSNDNNFDDMNNNGGTQDYSYGAEQNQNSNNNQLNNNNGIPDQNAFSDSLNNMGGGMVSQPGNDDSDKKQIRKRAIIIAGIGIALFLIIILIASKATKSKNTDEGSVKEVVTNQNVSNNANKNVDGIMQSGNSSNNNSSTSNNSTSKQNVNVTYTQDENGYTWTKISDSEDVSFDEDYKEMLFTVTGITHYARSVDTNNNLVIKTTVTGSISGLSGTYTLDIPYNKGIRLVVGNSFTVQVQLGSYKGKTIVGEIKY